MLFNFILLTVLQLAAGLAVVSLLSKIRSLILLISTSLLAGLLVNTLVVYAIGVFHLPVKWSTILIGLSITALLGLIGYKQVVKNITESWANFSFLPKIYELIFWGIFGYLFFISAWRAWYLPITPYDAINGIDLFAKFTIKENTFSSSIFDTSIISSLSTQTFYAPFTSFLQITYRLCGFPWGQVWLSIVFLGFVISAYHKLKERCHPIIVGIALLLLLMAPEFYAYTFLLQTDFTNAVFFGLAIIWFYDFWITEENDSFNLSLLWFFAACWSRSETIFFIPFGSLLLLIKFYRKGELKTGLIKGFIFGFIPGLTTILWNGIFYNLIFPRHPDSASEFKTPDYSISAILDIVNEMNDQVVFELNYWGYSLPIFFVIFLVSYFKFKDKQSLVIVAWMVILYFVFLMLKIHLVHISIPLTFRRGYFKFLMLYTIYLTSCQIVTNFSKKIWDWERG